MEAKKLLPPNLACKLVEEDRAIGAAITSLTARRKEIHALFALGFEDMPPNVSKFDIVNGDVKVTVAKNVNVAIDHAAIDVMRREIDPAIFPFKVEYKPVAAKMQALRQFNPELFAHCAGALIDKPGKAKVTLKQDPKNEALQDGIFPKAPK